MEGYTIVVMLVIGIYIWVLTRKRGLKELPVPELNEKKLKTFFMESSERYIASLGNGYIENFLINHTIHKGFVVVSDKRVYFKGKTYLMQGNRAYASSDERVVDVKDITGTGFTHTKELWALVVSIVCSVIILFWIPLFGGTYSMYLIDSPIGVLHVIIALAIISLIAYLVTKHDFFEIDFAGGKICFEIYWYSRSEIENFQKQLRLAKDSTNNAVEVNKESNEKEQISIEDKVDIASKIREYSDLFKEGIISEGEFNILKARVIGNKESGKE